MRARSGAQGGPRSRSRILRRNGDETPASKNGASGPRDTPERRGAVDGRIRTINSPRRGAGTKKTRRRRLRSPRHGEPFWMGGGPLTSMASLFATTSASATNLCGARRPRKRACDAHSASSGKPRHTIDPIHYDEGVQLGGRSPVNRARKASPHQICDKDVAGGTKTTRREPLEEPSAPVRAPSRTGRRASHLGGLALCVSTFASAREPIQRSLRRARPGRPRFSQRAGKCAAGARGCSTPIERLIRWLSNNG
jgi:hypothetical protein